MFRIWTYRVAPFTSQIQLVSWPLSVCIYQHFSERETKKKRFTGEIHGRGFVQEDSRSDVPGQEVEQLVWLKI